MFVTTSNIVYQYMKKKMLISIKKKEHISVSGAFNFLTKSILMLMSLGIILKYCALLFTIGLTLQFIKKISRYKALPFSY